MSIDLSSITEIRDKIGVITQIIDASGRVLWKSAPSTVAVTMQSDLPSGGSTIMGIDYRTVDGSYYNISSAGIYELPLGTKLDFWIGPEKGSGSASIYVNDEYVTGSSDGEKCSYYHTLTTNIIISVSTASSYGAFYITEVPVAFTINSTTYFAQENMTWENWFASSHNTTGKTADDIITITDSNGNIINLTDVIMNGTAYEVGFGPETVTITITGYWPGGTGVSIDDNPASAYFSPYEVPYGAVVACSNNGYSSEVREKESWISHNGSIVVDGLGTYSFIATKNTTINMDSWRSDYGTYSVPIEITEE